jgi:hypothetical protein
VLRWIAVTSTAYCLGGTMADGTGVRWGSVASNQYPLGTVMEVTPAPTGRRRWIVRDRIGWGTQLDFWAPSCASLRSGDGGPFASGAGTAAPTCWGRSCPRPSVASTLHRHPRPDVVGRTRSERQLPDGASYLPVGHEDGDPDRHAVLLGQRRDVHRGGPRTSRHTISSCPCATRPSSSGRPTRRSWKAVRHVPDGSISAPGGSVSARATAMTTRTPGLVCAPRSIMRKYS